MAVGLVPVGPGLPVEVARVLRSHEDAIRQLQRPRAPTPVFTVAAAGLPPAADWTNCVVRVSDLDILAVSNGTSWIRQDNGSAI